MVTPRDVKVAPRYLYRGGDARTAGPRGRADASEGQERSSAGALGPVRACARLGIGHKEVTPDGQISLEEVECIGACSWAPAMQVNYDFFHKVTPERLDQILDGLRKT